MSATISRLGKGQLPRSHGSWEDSVPLWMSLGGGGPQFPLDLSNMTAWVISMCCQEGARGSASRMEVTVSRNLIMKMTPPPLCHIYWSERSLQMQPSRGWKMTSVCPSGNGASWGLGDLARGQRRHQELTSAVSVQGVP